MRREEADLLAMTDVGKLSLKLFQAAELAVVQEVHQHEQLCHVVLQRRPRQQHLVLGRNLLQRLHKTKVQQPARWQHAAVNISCMVSVQCLHVAHMTHMSRLSTHSTWIAMSY